MLRICNFYIEIIAKKNVFFNFFRQNFLGVEKNVIKRISRSIRDTIENIEEIQGKDKYYAMLFLEDLNIRTTFEKKNNEHFHGYINRHRDYFREIRGSRDEKAFLQILAKNNLIKINERYSKDRFSKSYKSEIGSFGGWTTIKAKDYLNNYELRHHKERVKKRENKYKSILWHKKNIEKLVELDIKKLKLLFLEIGIDIEFNNKTELIKSLEKLETIDFDNSTKVLIRKTFDLLEIENTSIVKGDNSNRHYHALSNAPKKLRNCLKSKLVDKPFLVEIDVKNSQPTILMALIKANKMKLEQEILELTEQGKFYEVLGMAWGFDEAEITNNKKVRDKVKKLVYGTVLFAESRNNKYFKELKKFYPYFASAIEKLDEGRTLARDLQRLEVKIMIPIVKKYGGVGIHDSIILSCTSGALEVEIVKNEIIAKFKKLGVNVTLSIEIFE